MNTNALDWVAIAFVVLGAVAWGIIGVTGLTGDPLNVVSLVLEPIFRPGPAQTVEYIVYVLVGASGIYLLYTAYKMGRASRRATRERRRQEAARAESTRDRESTTGDTES